MTSMITYKSPIGFISIYSEEDYITRISFKSSSKSQKPDHVPTILKDCVEQLDEYFAGKRRSFDVSFAFVGTHFQERVWKALRTIPYGKMMSYKDLAKKVGNPRAYRAVGTACRQNPLPILIPCHRVVSAKGDVGKYAGGMRRKHWLLDHERAS